MIQERKEEGRVSKMTKSSRHNTKETLNRRVAGSSSPRTLPYLPFQYTPYEYYLLTTTPNTFLSLLLIE